MLRRKCQLKHTLASQVGEEQTHTHTVGHLEGEEASSTRADSDPANLNRPQFTTPPPPLSTTHAAREGKQRARM